MSDTSTAQPTWHGLSNRLTSSSLSVKEFVELPLLSSYNNAFLETITEEGSEFEPSDDGSASFEQSDYLPFESIRVEQATGSLVRADPSLMIGELESPDYEEVFPLPIQSFPSFHKELLDYSNLLVPFSKANCSDFSIEMQNGSQIYAKGTVSLQMNKDPDTLKHQSELVNGNTKEENNNDELIKTSDYQSYDEADMPTDGVDDWGEGLVLDQTPGRTETIKHVASSKSSGEALHSSEGCGVLLQSSDNPLNPGNPWINDQDLKEEVMILSTEDDEKFVWKLEHSINSQTVNQAAVMPSPQRSEFRFYLPQKTKENSFHFCSDRNDAPGNIALKQSSNKTDEPNGKLNDSQLTTNNEDNSAISSEGTRTLVETVKAPRHFITQTSSIPAIPRPILPRICNSDIAKPHMMDPEPIPPPKPQFPRHGYPELLFGQVKGLRSSFGLTIAPVTSASTSARPPLPPRPGSKPVMQNVNCFFQPALSYRELLSTTHPTDQTTIQKCQSYHSDSTAVQLYETNTLMDAATMQSFVDYRGPTFGSNLERMTNPLASSYPRFGGNSTSDRSAFLESQKNWSSNSYFGQLSQGFSGKSCMLQDQGDVLIENPAYMSTFFSESSKQREETSVHAPSKFIFGKSQPVTSKIQFTDANSVPSTSNVERNTPNECPLTERSSGDYHSINPVTTQVLPPSSIQTESQSKNYPIWIANSTPLAHYYASHSAMSGMVNKNGTTVSKVPELTINSALDNLSPPTEELVVQDNPNRLSTRTSSTNLPGQSLKSNPRPIQRSFAVVGVSELLAKTDEELNQFLQGAERKLVSSGPDLADELSNESSGNQISSTSGGPMEHSPVRRRFQSNRIGPTVNRQSFDSVETESDSDHLDRRSFYDYGCDDDDDDIEESNGNDIDEVVSEVELRGVRRTVRAGDRDGFSGSKPFTSAETDGILCQLKLLNENTQLVWSDSCPVAASSQEHKSIKELDYTASQSDMPFIDSDSFQNEPWNNGIGGADVWRLNYSYKPIRANLDEVTLSSGKSWKTVITQYRYVIEILQSFAPNS
ncbi:hypothetical protein FGIG_06517 [Fasciola gigantica]|uniref:Uncharacterized protein n=1 Tax=Fasciola gigantica TaxID=46835 RepID=A0A504XIE8_FASGI|nr:hypothetical protein FGIG_06517 [Fasciola gigantica]